MRDAGPPLVLPNAHARRRAPEDPHLALARNPLQRERAPAPRHYDELNEQTEGNGKMAIYLVTHRKGGNPADVIAAASRLKALATKHGAEDLQLHARWSLRKPTQPFRQFWRISTKSPR